MAKKTKVELKELTNGAYEVVKLTNRCDLKRGEKLKKKQVEDLILEKNCTVTIR